MLKAGETRIKAENAWQALATGPGYFKIQRDRAIVLVDDAVRAEEIDVEQARREADERAPCSSARTPARRGIDRWRVGEQLRHAENKIAVAGRRLTPGIRRRVAPTR